MVKCSEHLPANMSILSVVSLILSSCKGTRQGIRSREIRSALHAPNFFSERTQSRPEQSYNSTPLRKPAKSATYFQFFLNSQKLQKKVLKIAQNWSRAEN